ncbi:MAG: LPS assembly lipoprotein LptE [Rhodospirillales bacterium]|nr:LPS assembly lipoprotein LptE [Rhodospirillales bacterium]
MLLFRTIILILGLSLITSCGFRPLYGKHSYSPKAQQKLEKVFVKTIVDRKGQLLRNELQTILAPKGLIGSPLYSLSVTVTESETRQLQRTDETATRAELRLSANFSLTDLKKNQTIISGQSIGIASYDLVDAEYSQIVAAKNAQKRAARDVALDIKSRLSTFFLNPPKKK